MNKVYATIATIGTFLAAVPKAFAQTPTITALDPVAGQLVVNTAASVQATMFDMLELIWPYALTIALVSFAIAYGLGKFQKHK